MENFGLGANIVLTFWGERFTCPRMKNLFEQRLPAHTEMFTMIHFATLLYIFWNKMSVIVTCELVDVE